MNLALAITITLLTQVGGPVLMYMSIASGLGYPVVLEMAARQLWYTGLPTFFLSLLFYYILVTLLLGTRARLANLDKQLKEARLELRQFQAKVLFLPKK